MNRRYVLGAALMAFGLAAFGPSTAAEKEKAKNPYKGPKTKDGFTKLFNGKNLNGFYTFLGSKGKNNDPDRVFTVEDGAVRVSGKEAGYFATENEFDNYHLRYQIKWPAPKRGGRNAGALLHLNGPDRVWPTSIEVQGQEGSIGDFWIIGDAGLTVDGVRKTGEGDRHFRRKPTEAEKPAGEWNQVDVFADGDTVTVLLNGEEIHRGINGVPTRGKIAFQSEGSELYYRDIQIKPLKKNRKGAAGKAAKDGDKKH
ncbi:MAG: DUF1080 domain-containing protein [Armatimonadetes bacterium]|nr:DUF1080 domain-containing protein [Armatimonadota bacterium]